MTTNRLRPQTTRRPGAPGVIQGWHTTNSAMHMLNNAPMSYASTTPMPTAIPASTTRTQWKGSSSRTNNPIAMKLHATQIACDATPQAAPEKNPVFNIVANAPSTQARFESPSRRKQKPAASPSMSKASGVKNLAQATAFRANTMTWVTDRLLLMPWLPMEFRSCQAPWKFDHFICAPLAMAPSGPSLENRMYSGTKLRANKAASTAVSRSSKNPPGWRRHQGQVCGFLSGSIGRLYYWHNSNPASKI